MKKVVVLILLVLLPIVSAQSQEFGNVSELVMSVSISSLITKESGTLHTLKTTVCFIPQEFENQVLLSQEFSADPPASITLKENAVT